MNKETIGNSEINTDSGISKSNRINTKVLITASIVLSIFLVLSGTVSSEDYPSLPNRFSGDVMLNGEPAPVETVINAYIGGELRGSVTVTTAGEYNLLGVEGSNLDEGATIAFTAGGFNAVQTAAWYEGSGPHLLDLTTTTSSEVQFIISLNAGWNAVSIPVIPANASVAAIFGDNITPPVYEYDAGYIAATSLEPKKGYWVLADSPVDINITGTVPSDPEITLAAGWNMIGPVSSGVQVSSFADIILPVYGYDSGYTSVDTLEPTKGYWVLASAETTITV